jgi:hypothetical protein
MGHWAKYTDDRGKPKYWEKNLTLSHRPKEVTYGAAMVRTGLSGRDASN